MHVLANYRQRHDWPFGTWRGGLDEKEGKGTAERTITRDVLLWANGERTGHAFQA